MTTESCGGQSMPATPGSARRWVRATLAVLALWLTVLAVPHAQAPNIAGKFYEYKLIAASGNTPSSAPSPLTGMGNNPSINSLGLVAFVGQFATGEGIVVGDGLTPTKLINPGFLSGTRVFGRAVQVNDKNKVLANDRVSGAPPTYFERLWDTTTGAFTVVARGGSTFPFDAVFNQSSVNTNGDTVFGALLGAQTLLVSVQANGTLKQIVLPNNSLARPMIADNGKIVVRFGNTVNSPIFVYPPDLSAPQLIAGTANFSVTGNQPGISRDGHVVAFYGVLNAAGAAALNTTPGPGIFAAIDEGGASWRIVRVLGRQVEDLTVVGGNQDGICDVGESCKPVAELGYSALGAPIYFASPAGADGFTANADSRIGVTNLDLGAAGIDDDTFVVSFQGTPTQASRDNPALPGKPLLFSGALGLWTVRVDVEKVPIPINGTIGGSKTYHSYGAIPVTQIGDVIGGHTITGISLFDPIAAAATDDAGAIRTQRRGDHRLGFLAFGSAGEQLIVRASHLDSDQDGLLDSWETTGIDMDQDGVPDLVLSGMGSNPNKRDLFLEMDWLARQPGQKNFEPAPNVIQSAFAPGPLPNMFANAPKLTGNMYGATIDGSAPKDIPAGISLHVDAGIGVDTAGRPLSYNMNAGSLQGGDEIGVPGAPNALVDVVYLGVPPLQCGTPPGPCAIPPGITTRSYQDIKDHFFGTSDKDARELAFHYVVLAMTQGFVLNGLNQPIVSGVTAATANTITLPSPAPGLACSLQVQPVPAASLCGQIVKVTQGKGAGGFSAITAVAGNKLTLITALNVIPDATSSIVVLAGSSGLAELSEQNPNSVPADNNSIPGNDSLITLGGFGYDSKQHLGNACFEWRTIAHELGHTLGLRHGGIDDSNFLPNYFSLMNYTWQTACPSAGPASIVQSYSTAADPTFFDFGNLKHFFFNAEYHLGNSFLLGGLGNASQDPSQHPEVTVIDLLQTNGPLDQLAPVVSIVSPTVGTAVAVGTSVTVTVTVTDDAAVDSVDLALDLDGNGVATDPGERVPATLVTGNTYQATFGALSGLAGPRTLEAFGTDPSGNVGSDSINVVVVLTGPAQVAVPNVVGLTQAAATTAITGAGLVLGTVTSAASATVPAGNVISETPGAGTLVDVGSAVNLVMSTGPAQVAVPNVVGLTQAAATTAITGVGLVLGTVTSATSATVPAGNVISEAPGAGTLVNVGSAVNLVVSTGPAQVAVPNVVGLTQGAATTAITGVGLVLGTVTSATSATVPAGNVISEAPGAGTLVDVGSAVNLVVSTGPAQVAVPNVVGLTQGAATTAITGVGLVLGTVTSATSATVPAGNVISEAPGAGTLVDVGSAVNLVVSTGPAQVAVPNVVGLTQAAATTAITGVGLVLGTVTSATSATVPAGNVISEAPGAGTLVNVGSAVNLVVSTGPAQVTVLKCDANGDGVITAADLVLIRNANGQGATGPDDPRDGNSDGSINVADVRFCQLRLTPQIQ